MVDKIQALHQNKNVPLECKFHNITGFMLSYGLTLMLVICMIRYSFYLNFNNSPTLWRLSCLSSLFVSVVLYVLFVILVLVLYVFIHGDSHFGVIYLDLVYIVSLVNICCLYIGCRNFHLEFALDFS